MVRNLSMEKLMIENKSQTRRGRPPTSADPLLKAVAEAGKEGISSLELAEKLGWMQRRVNETIQNERTRNKSIYSLVGDGGRRNALRHFAASVPLDQAKAAIARAASAYSEKIREACRAYRQEYAELIKAMEREDAAVQAEIALARQVRAENRAKARELAKEKEAAKRKPKASPAMRKATVNINKLADRYRGTVSPSAIRPAEPKPAALVDIPGHLIYRAPPPPERWAAVQGAGVISRRIGEYEGEASAWVRAVATA